MQKRSKSRLVLEHILGILIFLLITVVFFSIASTAYVETTRPTPEILQEVRGGEERTMSVASLTIIGLGVATYVTYATLFIVLIANDVKEFFARR